MKLQFSTEDKIIISHMLEVRISTIYSLHEKYMLSPAQLVRSIRKLQKLGIVSFGREEIQLADNAKLQIFKLRHKIYNRPKPWREVPDVYRQPSLTNDWEYIPVTKKLINVFSKF